MKAEAEDARPRRRKNFRGEWEILCSAKKKWGAPCGGPVVPGRKVCHWHLRHPSDGSKRLDHGASPKTSEEDRGVGWIERYATDDEFVNWKHLRLVEMASSRSPNAPSVKVAIEMLETQRFEDKFGTLELAKRTIQECERRLQELDDMVVRAEGAGLRVPPAVIEAAAAGGSEEVQTGGSLGGAVA